jgi:multiple sugar transport system permease protein
MVIERRWKKWLYFYLPLTVFIVATLFPFYWMLITAIRPDAELYRSWRAVNNAPFWTLQPTLDHFRDLLEKTTYPRWLWNTFFIAVMSTMISLVCGLFAGYALARLRFPGAGLLARPSSSRTSCRRRCCSSRWPTSSGTFRWATRRGP